MKCVNSHFEQRQWFYSFSVRFYIRKIDRAKIGGHFRLRVCLLSFQCYFSPTLFHFSRSLFNTHTNRHCTDNNFPSCFSSISILVQTNFNQSIPVSGNFIFDKCIPSPRLGLPKVVKFPLSGINRKCYIQPSSG